MHRFDSIFYRLSQTNAHRLQGIVSDSSPERTGSPDDQDRTGKTPGAGYSHDKRRERDRVK